MVRDGRSWQVEPDARFRTSPCADVENESLAVVRIGRLGLRVHALPGRGDEQPVEIAADKYRAARLPRRNPDGADTVAFRRIGVNAGSAPARVPDQSFGIDDRAVETA